MALYHETSPLYPRAIGTGDLTPGARQRGQRRYDPALRRGAGARIRQRILPEERDTDEDRRRWEFEQARGLLTDIGKQVDWSKPEAVKGVKTFISDFLGTFAKRPEAPARPGRAPTTRDPVMQRMQARRVAETAPYRQKMAEQAEEQRAAQEALRHATPRPGIVTTPSGRELPEEAMELPPETREGVQVYGDLAERRKALEAGRPGRAALARVAIQRVRAERAAREAAGQQFPAKAEEADYGKQARNWAWQEYMQAQKEGRDPSPRAMDVLRQFAQERQVGPKEERIREIQGKPEADRTDEEKAVLSEFYGVRDRPPTGTERTAEEKRELIAAAAKRNVDPTTGKPKPLSEWNKADLEELYQRGALTRPPTQPSPELAQARIDYIKARIAEMQTRASPADMAILRAYLGALMRTGETIEHEGVKIQRGGVPPETVAQLEQKVRERFPGLLEKAPAGAPAPAAAPAESAAPTAGAGEDAPLTDEERAELEELRRIRGSAR